jgi:hypothetical protein
MTFPETAIEAAKRGLSIHIRPYGEGVGVYVKSASGHEFAKAAPSAIELERVLAAIPETFVKAAAEEAKGPPEGFSLEDVSCGAAAGLNLLGMTWPRPIPVSERLPEESDGYEGGSVTVLGFCSVDGEETWEWREAFCKHGEKGGHVWFVERMKREKPVYVTHWMPLPPEPTHG